MSLAVGAHSITVSYSGDAVYRPSTSGAFRQTVYTSVAGIYIASTSNPSTSSQAVTLTAALTGGFGTPSGIVSFNDNGIEIDTCGSLAVSGGNAQCTTSSLAIGAHSITVTYSGDAVYRPSTSGIFTQTVYAAVAGIYIASASNPSISGQAIMLSATLTGGFGTPSGTVTFNDNGVAIDSCSSLTLLGGAAQCTTASPAVGTHSITVTYGGDAVYRPGISGVFTQVVNASGAKFDIASTDNPSTEGEAVTLTAMVTGANGIPSGNVTFNDSAVAIPACGSLTLSAGVAQCTISSLAVGSHSITFTYSGDATYRPGTSGIFIQTVGPGPAKWTGTAQVNGPYGCTDHSDVVDNVPYDYTICDFDVQAVLTGTEKCAGDLVQCPATYTLEGPASGGCTWQTLEGSTPAPPFFANGSGGFGWSNVATSAGGYSQFLYYWSPIPILMSGTPPPGDGYAVPTTFNFTCNVTIFQGDSRVTGTVGPVSGAVTISGHVPQ